VIQYFELTTSAVELFYTTKARALQVSKLLVRVPRLRAVPNASYDMVAAKPPLGLIDFALSPSRACPRHRSAHLLRMMHQAVAIAPMPQPMVSPPSFDDIQAIPSRCGLIPFLLRAHVLTYHPDVVDTEGLALFPSVNHTGRRIK
jgi:hypothetical protein